MDGKARPRRISFAARTPPADFFPSPCELHQASPLAELVGLFSEAEDGSMHNGPTDNNFDPAIWAIATALSAALIYLALLN